MSVELSGAEPEFIPSGIDFHYNTLKREGNNGDNWCTTWAGDGNQYTSMCDGVGWVPGPNGNHGGSNPSPNFWHTAVLRIKGSPENVVGEHTNNYIARPAEYFFGYGILSVEGTLYQFLSRQFKHSFSPPFQGAALVSSPNYGDTWYAHDDARASKNVTGQALNPAGSEQFFWHEDARTRSGTSKEGYAFSCMSFCQMGKDYGQAKDNYVYIYSPDGPYPHQLNMARVPKDKITDKSQYRYFTSRNSDGSANWTSHIGSRGVVHSFPQSNGSNKTSWYSWLPSVVWNEKLGLYIMSNGATYNNADFWGVGDDLHAQSGSLGLYYSEKPWGPWTEFYYNPHWTSQSSDERTYQPKLSPKWISSDGKEMVLIWSDAKDRWSTNYKWNQMKFSIEGITTQPQQDELIGHWKLDESNGTTAQDASGKGNSLSLRNGAGSGSGVLQNALSLDGVNDDAQRSSASSALRPRSISLAAWVKSDQTSKKGWVAAQGDNYGLCINRYDDSDDILFYYKHNDGWTDISTGDVNITDGKWHHIAASFDADTKIMKVYKDGIRVAQRTSSYGAITYTTGNDFTIGSMQGQRHFDGSIDDVRAYNYSLSASAVHDLANVDAPSPLRILALGDSITQSNSTHQSYRYNLWKKLIDADIEHDFIGSQNSNNNGNPSWPNYADYSFDRHHEGHWGWRADQVLSSLPGWLNSYTPDVVMLYLGINDLNQGQSASGTISELSSIIDLLRADNPQVKILLGQFAPTDWSVNPGLNALVTAFNPQLAQLASNKNTTNSQVIIVDHHSGFNASTDTFDGLHPDASGEEKIAQNWINALIGNSSNNAPHADAGSDQTKVDGNGNGSETVTLNGGSSSDSDGSIVSYIWRKNGAQIASGANPNVSLSIGSHRIVLTVTDNDGASDTDAMDVLIQSPAPTTNELVAHWTLDETSGSTRVDTSGNGNDLSLRNGADHSAGVLNNGLSLDGINDDASRSNVSAVLRPTSVTLAAWVRSSNSSQVGWVVAQGDNYGIDINRSSNSDGVRFYYKHQTGWTSVSSGDVNMTDGEWHHIAASFDAASGVMTVYKDGVAIKNETSAFGAISYTTGDGFTVGSMKGDRHFDGNIDEVRIYNYALTGNAVSTLANVSTPTSGLIAHWQLDESGNTCVDASSNGNDLSLRNGAGHSAGVLNNGLSLDGINDDASRNNVSAALRPASVTLAAWVRSSNSSQKGWVAAQGDNYGININRYDNTDDVQFYYRHSSGWTSVSTGDVNITDGQWHHIAASFDASSGLMTVYKDGVAVNDKTSTHGAISYTTGNGFTIGSMQGDRHFDGNIDEVRVYDYALTANEVSALADAGASDFFAASINFQPAVSAVPAGYLVDSGLAFGSRGDGLSYGWDSRVPYERERHSSNAVDQRYDTLIHLQKSGNHVWEIALPNGEYEVYFVAGDAAYTDQISNFDLEGVVVHDPDGEDHFDNFTVFVEVMDGRLTLKPAAGSSNSKLCFIEILEISSANN